MSQTNPNGRDEEAYAEAQKAMEAALAGIAIEQETEDPGRGNGPQRPPHASLLSRSRDSFANHLAGLDQRRADANKRIAAEHTRHRAALEPFRLAA